MLTTGDRLLPTHAATAPEKSRALCQEILEVSRF